MSEVVNLAVDEGWQRRGIGTAVMESVDERIKQAVTDLPHDLRMVFLLSTIEGLKYREIAEVMDCPLGTVMSRLFRSRRMLQERLTDYATDGDLNAVFNELWVSEGRIGDRAH